MTVLLLCGYRPCDTDEKALAVAIIDQRIAQLRQLGFEVICVLAGQHADEQLRLCRSIATCELVFDTHEQPNIATNLKAGLAATDGSGCFAIPVELPCPPREAWVALREAWRHFGFHTETEIYQNADQQGALSHFGFPLLVTRKGNKAIKGLTEFRSLTDTRLKYHKSADADLASV